MWGVLFMLLINYLFALFFMGMGTMLYLSSSKMVEGEVLLSLVKVCFVGEILLLFLYVVWISFGVMGMSSGLGLIIVGEVWFLFFLISEPTSKVLEFNSIN